MDYSSIFVKYKNSWNNSATTKHISFKKYIIQNFISTVALSLVIPETILDPYIITFYFTLPNLSLTKVYVLSFQRRRGKIRRKNHWEIHRSMIYNSNNIFRKPQLFLLILLLVLFPHTQTVKEKKLFPFTFFSNFHPTFFLFYYYYTALHRQKESECFCIASERNKRILKALYNAAYTYIYRIYIATVRILVFVLYRL